MLLITPDVLAKMLCPGEYKSFLADMLPSVPDRTRRNLKKGVSPSKKTIETIISDLSSGSSFSEEELRQFLASQSPQPWKNAITGLKKGMRKHYPSSFDYSTEIIVQVESAPFKAAKAQVQDTNMWRKLTGLPPAVMPDSFMKTCLHIGKRKKKDKTVPIGSGRVLLRTNLFILAALETSLINSDLVPSGSELWMHKMMPHYKEGKLIEPMREFFEVIMEKQGIPSVAQFAEVLPPLTIPGREKNIDSQKRQIHRWMSGETPPSWENMRSISNTFFEGDDGPMVSYGVARFLQSLLKELRDKYVPAFFEDEEELVSVFQEYPKWQEFHGNGLTKWNKARG